MYYGELTKKLLPFCVGCYINTLQVTLYRIINLLTIGYYRITDKRVNRESFIIDFT